MHPPAATHPACHPPLPPRLPGAGRAVHPPGGGAGRRRLGSGRRHAPVPLCCAAPPRLSRRGVCCCMPHRYHPVQTSASSSSLPEQRGSEGWAAAAIDATATTACAVAASALDRIAPLRYSLCDPTPASVDRNQRDAPGGTRGAARSRALAGAVLEPPAKSPSAFNGLLGSLEGAGREDPCAWRPDPSPLRCWSIQHSAFGAQGCLGTLAATHYPSRCTRRSSATRRRRHCRPPLAVAGFEQAVIQPATMSTQGQQQGVDTRHMSDLGEDASGMAVRRRAGRLLWGEAGARGGHGGVERAAGVVPVLQLPTSRPCSPSPLKCPPTVPPWPGPRPGRPGLCGGPHPQARPRAGGGPGAAALRQGRAGCVRTRGPPCLPSA